MPYRALLLHARDAFHANDACNDRGWHFVDKIYQVCMIEGSPPPQVVNLAITIHRKMHSTPGTFCKQLGCPYGIRLTYYYEPFSWEV